MKIQKTIATVILAASAWVIRIPSCNGAADWNETPSPVPSKLTLPRSQRPEWLRRDGIVMAGSWEPLLFRVRRDGASGYTPTSEQRAAYAREHSPEMVAGLKSLGVNFVMLHCYKGAGLKAERESMDDAVKFARLCHDAGLRVGCYTYSGAFLWDQFFQEMPQARDWVVRDAGGKPVTYGNATYRYYWNRNYSDAQAFYRKLIRFAVRDIRTDLVHLDNYVVGPGYDANSVERFRRYLRSAFSARELKSNGITNLNKLTPPERRSTNLLARAWADFSCRSIADAYLGMGRYARRLRRDILMECNPGGVAPMIHVPVDHGRLLRGGEAFWDEGAPPGFIRGALRTRIRTYKAARSLDNSAFVYVTNPLEAAEAMAFNLDCLGAICWFEYGRIVKKPGVTTPMSSALGPFVDFFHKRRELLRDARVVADVGVLRSFSSMQFGPPHTARLTGAVEDTLITNRIPFQMVFDTQLDGLARWPVLILPACVALSDGQVMRLRSYVALGGHLCVIGPLATHDEWMLPRKRPALDNLPPGRVVRVAEDGDWLEGIPRACGGQFSLRITSDLSSNASHAGDALEGLCAELTEQRDRRLVHLVNYRSNGLSENLAVRVALPKQTKVKSVTLAGPEHATDTPLPIEQQPGYVVFTVPKVGVYEIAIVECVRAS